MSGEKLFEGLSAPEPIVGTVQTTLTLETGALDLFLKDLLDALKKLGKDVAQSQDAQEQLAKDVATNQESTEKEITALKQQISALKGEDSKQEETHVVEPESVAAPKADSGVSGDELAKLRKDLEDGLKKGQKERDALKATQDEQSSKINNVEEGVKNGAKETDALKAKQDDLKSKTDDLGKQVSETGENLAALSDKVENLARRLKGREKSFKAPAENAADGSTAPSEEAAPPAPGTALTHDDLNGIHDDMDELREKANATERKLEAALSKLDGADTNATDALSKATEAKEEAKEAKDDAVAAKSDAQKAATEASDALTKASDAVEECSAAKTEAAAAMTKATDALSRANTDANMGGGDSSGDGGAAAAKAEEALRAAEDAKAEAARGLAVAEDALSKAREALGRTVEEGGSGAEDLGVRVGGVERGVEGLEGKVKRLEKELKDAKGKGALARQASMGPAAVKESGGGDAAGGVQGAAEAVPGPGTEGGEAGQDVSELLDALKEELREEMEGLEKKVEGGMKEVDGMKGKVSGVERRLKNGEGMPWLDALQDKAGRLENRVAGVERRVADLGAKAPAKKVEEVSETTAPTESLGGEEAGLRSDVEALRGEVELLRSDVEQRARGGGGGAAEATGAGAGSKTEVDGLRRELGDVRGSIRKVESDVVKVKESVNALKSEVARGGGGRGGPVVATGGGGSSPSGGRSRGKQSRPVELPPTVVHVKGGGEDVDGKIDALVSDMDSVRDWLAKLAQRFNAQAEETEDLKDGVGRALASRDLADSALEQSKRNNVDMEAFSSLFKDFISKVDGQMKKVLDDKKPEDPNASDLVTKNELKQVLDDINTQWGDQLYKAYKNMRELKRNMDSMGRRSAAANYKCLSCTRPVPEGRQMLYWSRPSIDPALAPMSDGRVYRVTKEHEMPVGSVGQVPVHEESSSATINSQADTSHAAHGGVEHQRESIPESPRLSPRAVGGFQGSPVKSSGGTRLPSIESPT